MPGTTQVNWRQDLVNQRHVCYVSTYMKRVLYKEFEEEAQLCIHSLLKVCQLFKQGLTLLWCAQHKHFHLPQMMLIIVVNT